MYIVPLVVASLPDDHAQLALQFVGKHLDTSSHIEFYLKWACTMLSVHGPKDNVLSHQSLLTLHQSLNRKYEQLSKICDFNKYTIKVLSSMPYKQDGIDDDYNDDESESESELVLVKSDGNDVEMENNNDSESEDSE